MQTAKDIMTREVVSVGPETEVAEAARLLLERHINGVPVVDEAGQLVGILCQSDLISQQKRLSLPSLFTTLDGFIPLTSLKKVEREIEKMAAATVGDLMTKKVRSVEPDTGVDEIATLMVNKNYHTIPVVDGGKLVGVVAKEDILKTMTG
ncbi:MAG: CBS domain-containing protein [Desulfatibacillaceae bacterium]